MRLAAGGLGSALIPLGCAQEVGQQRQNKQLPTPDEPLTPTHQLPELDAWYAMSIVGAYEADEESYRLKVSGAVDDGLSLSVGALRSEFEPGLEMITLACVGNTPNGRLVSSAYFRGARMRDVIARAGVSSHASGAFISGLDGFVSYQSMDDLMRSESLLAYDMGIDPDALERLPIDHGFPCRILTPGKYGYMQPKWIDAITFVDHGGNQSVVSRSIPYFAGDIQLASGFTTPRGGRHSPGEIEVLGFAFGDGRPIAKVEVSVDGGAWRQTEIVYNEMSDALPSYLWALWRFVWDAPVGSHELRCRAHYEDGTTQFEGMRFPYSGGSIAAVRIGIREPGA